MAHKSKKSRKAIHKLGITLGLIVPAILCLTLKNEGTTLSATILATATNLWWLWEF